MKKCSVMKNINVKNISYSNSSLKKPNWIKIKIPIHSLRIRYMKSILRSNNLHSVCEEAACPNLLECFNQGTVTFMILGAICTRKCPFCAVKHGRPMSVNASEAMNLARTIKDMKINYVVLTSVARDDLRDGGSGHFSSCITAIRSMSKVKIEILVPDFKNCRQMALNIIGNTLPDIFNHNIENVPRLYKIIRPGADYNSSLTLLNTFKKLYSHVPTKSGFMLGLGETDVEIVNLMKDLYRHGVNMITIGQYLQPSKLHLPVKRYYTLLEFKDIEKEALSIGFSNVFCGPLVRSSYHAYKQSQIYNYKINK